MTIGYEPEHLTLRQLLEAFEFKQRTTWQHTSLIACILANAHRDPKKQKKPFTPSDFDPYSDKPSTHSGNSLNANTLALFFTAVSSFVGKSNV